MAQGSCCGGEPSGGTPIRIPLLGDAEPNLSPPQEFPYRNWPCVTGSVATPVGAIPRVDTTLTWRDLLGRWAMRWGFGREHYRVRPGLYALGNPDPSSAVLVSANYKLSFDLLRSALVGRNLWILVLDTKGINVWCAAGKGTFGTGELLRQIFSSGLAEVVSHRSLIVPQLGAVGVAAHQVVQGSGFRVVYGPIGAADLPAFLDSGLKATPAMRRVTFGAGERLILTPVELTGLRRHLLWIAPTLFLLGGVCPQVFSLSNAVVRGGSALALAVVAVLAGAVVTPLLLPWIPGRAFALKGGIVGAVVAITVATLLPEGVGTADVVALLAIVPAVASYCAMNFTGSSTFTSPSGVEKEMRRYLPVQLVAVAIAGIAWIAGAFAP